MHICVYFIFVYGFLGLDLLWRFISMLDFEMRIRQVHGHVVAKMEWWGGKDGGGAHKIIVGARDSINQDFKAEISPLSSLSLFKAFIIWPNEAFFSLPFFDFLFKYFNFFMLNLDRQFYMQLYWSKNANFIFWVNWHSDSDLDRFHRFVL